MQAEVLGVLRAGHAALSAYDILDALRPSHQKLAPPTVYNALAVLTQKGLVHRVETLKAYIACQCGDHSHTPILSVCDRCGTVKEHDVPDLLKTVSSYVDDTGFTPERHVIEIHGLCASCGTKSSS